MYLIDQHAAHERVLYERLLAQQATADVAVQRLLEPLTVELTPAQAEELETWLEPLLKLGFEVEPFGGHTVLVRAIPTTLGRIDVRQTLAGILDDLSLEQEAAGRRDRRADGGRGLQAGRGQGRADAGRGRDARPGRASSKRPPRRAPARTDARR